MGAKKIRLYETFLLHYQNLCLIEKETDNNNFWGVLYFYVEDLPPYISNY